MREIQHHGASVLVVPEGTVDRVLVNIYDEYYPVRIFRGHLTFLGGTREQDTSPRDTLTREVSEELGIIPTIFQTPVGSIIGSPEANYIPKIDEPVKQYSTIEFRTRLQSTILEKMQPYGDFLAAVREGTVTQHRLRCIISTYISAIDRALFDSVAEELCQGKELVNEGYSRIVTIDSLVQGIPRAAWGYATVLRNMLGVSVPEYDFMEVVPLYQKPRSTYADYKKEFVYIRDPEHNP